MSTVRVLVVEDHRDWRKLVRLILQIRPEWQVICEVSDGSEAVQKAEELKPDLILLDIGLPSLNGIEASRRIRQLSPNSKIIFLTTDDSLDVAQEALSTGAKGYVYKARARIDLLPAIEAVLRGDQFVSSGLKGDPRTDAPETKSPHRHEVQFYSDELVLLDRLVRFVVSVLAAGNVAMVIATQSHRDRLAERLKSEGLDVDAAIIEGTYIPVDAVSTLSLFMVNDMPNSARFLEVVGCLIEEAAKKRKVELPRVAIFGEWVSLLCAEGKTDAAIRLEQLGNQLSTTYEIDLLCGHELKGLRSEEDGKAVQRICAEHSVVYI